MVFFTCNHCGESVKKPAVEKHYNTRCRGAPKNVSCMDCQKDFRNEEYVAHTKCITEMQKYSGKDYVPKESKNSGAKKQESWMDTIGSILETSEYKLSAAARSAFQRLQSVDNVPRKKAKFQNFVGNCMKMPRNLAEEVWNVLEQELEKMKKNKEAEMAEAKAAQEAAKKAKEEQKETNGVKREAAGDDDAEPATKKTKTSKQNGEVTNGHQAEEEEAVEGEPEEFQWSVVLEKLVSKNPDGLAIGKLKKKILKKYLSHKGLAELAEKQQKKFDKKFTKNLDKCPAVQVEGELAKAC